MVKSFERKFLLTCVQVGTAALYSCIGLGVGGNLPVDGALFIEFIPTASGNLLTLLSIFWPVGQLISSLRKPQILHWYIVFSNTS